MRGTRHIFSFFLLACLFAHAVQGQRFQPIDRSLPEGVVLLRDLPYSSVQNRSLLLDLYRPADKKEEFLPTIVVIRGGGFRSGDKEGFGPIAAALALQGFATVCIEYRTSKEALFPAGVWDTKAAVKWVRDHAEKYHLDQEAIGAIGGSAGGHLAMNLAVSGRVDPLNPTKSESDYLIHAAVALAPLTDFEQLTQASSLHAWLGKSWEEEQDLWKLASPTTHIDEHAAPLMIIHSSEDKAVPYEQSISAMQLYASNGVHAELTLLPHAPHAFWNSINWFDETIDAAARFFRKQFSQ
ncbi:MAG: alpha/beta hydrolase [Bacteroidota bacterium]